MKALILLASLTLSTASFAGPGHGHSHEAPEATKEKVTKIGRQQVDRLIKLGKLEMSWQESKFGKSEKKKFKGHTEWVVTFNNKKGVKGKKLYVFLKLSGEFIAANYTGK